MSVRCHRVPRPELRTAAAVLLLAGAAGLAGAATAAAESVHVSAPEVVPCVPPPEPAAGFVTMTRDVPLDALLGGLEEASPREFGSDGWEVYPRAEGDLRIRTAMSRGPLTVRCEGDRVTVESDVSYRMDVEGEGFAPTGCGSPAEPILVRTAVDARVGWRDDWHVDARSVPRALIHESRCKPKPPGENFTLALSKRIQERQLRPLADAIEAAAARSEDVPRAVAAAWAALTREKEFRSREWRLVLSPVAIRADPLRCENGTIVADVAFEVRPRVVAADGAAPAPLPPLPPPRVRLADGVLRIPFDLEIPWAQVHATAAGHLVGRSFGDRRGEFRVDAVRVFGSGERVLFELRLSGAIEGTAYLEGVPAFDEEDRAVTVTGIRPTDATIAALGPDGLHDFGAGLQLVLRFPVGEALGRRTEELGRAVNGAWGDGVTMRGGLARWESRTAFVSPTGVGVRSVLAGSAAVTVGPPPGGSAR